MVAPQGNCTQSSLLRVETGNAMELKPMYQRLIGLDLHQAKISACALAQQADGTVSIEQREFGPEVVVMESTGIYWKSSYAALDAVGIAAWVVNARHVKNVPGRWRRACGASSWNYSRA